MPTTPAHILIHTPAARVLVRDADVECILTGCVIPNAPWILARVIRALPVDIAADPLQAFAHAQSSLAVCLLLAGGRHAVQPESSRC